MRCGAMAEANDYGDGGKHDQRHIGADAACVLKPFADVEADDVEDHGHQQQAERNRQEECAVLGQRDAAASDDVSGHRGAGEKQAWEIKDGVDPVSPAGDESVEVSEGFFRPRIESALFGESRGELVDNESAGDEKE